MIFTSCYKLNSGASTTTVVTVSGTYTIGSTDSDYTFTSASSCNLDEANGKIIYILYHNHRSTHGKADRKDHKTFVIQSKLQLTDY